MISLALLVGALTVTARAAQTNPVSKVIELLEGLEAQVTKEGEDAAKLKSEKDTYCKDAATNLGFEISTGTDTVAELEATIGKESATMSSLDEKISGLISDSASDDKDLKAATTVRTAEIADFEAEESELGETIGALQRAISILEREMAKSGGAALVQVSDAGSIVQALNVMVKASAFSAADASRLTAFVQSSHQSADADTGAPDASVYTSSSGGIVDVLEDLLDKAQSQLSDARAKETTAQHNFDLLKQSLTDSMKFGAKQLEEAKTAKAKAGEAKSTAEGELAAASADLAADKAMLEEVTKDCAEYADSYAAESESRAAELAAIKKALAILTESTAGADSVAYGLVQASAPSFLQVRRGSQHRSDKADAAARYVRDLAHRIKSPSLSQLAAHIASAMRLSMSSREDPFVKVKDLIAELISKLEKDASQDAEQKAYCDEETLKATTKKADKTALVEKLTTKIDQMTADSAKLKDSVATLQKELAELSAMQTEMDTLRKKENALFLAQKKELTDGITGVEAAMKILKEYYGSDAAHDAKEGAAGGIIGMLEVILSDFSKSLAEITSTEDSAQSEYEATTQDNKVTKAAKDQDVAYQTKEAAALDKYVTEASADRATTQAELDAVVEYLAKLEAICVAKPETYAERADRRAAELAGLKKALDILEG